MATQAQVLANQANAQLSTGPTSPEGRKRSVTSELPKLRWRSRTRLCCTGIAQSFSSLLKPGNKMPVPARVISEFA